MRSKAHSVRRRIADLRLALLAPTPEGLESQLPALALALEELQAADSTLPLAELRALAQDLNNVQKLIAHGLATQRALAGLLAAALGAGYQPDGEPSPLAAPQAISVEG